MTSLTDEYIPAPGQWPVAPQDDVPIEEERIWIDGCFDFTHHGMSRIPQEFMKPYLTRS